MRDELIRAAIEKFGQCGYDAVGTRELAASVGTAMSSITYHFGGKEGLYKAAAEHIINRLHQTIHEPAIEMPNSDAPHEEHLSALCAILRRMGEFMLRDESAPFALFIGREQQLPTPAVMELMNQKTRPMLEGVVGLVRVLRPDLDDKQARVTVIYLFGMAASLRHSRAMMQMVLGIEKIDPDCQDTLLDMLDQIARRVLAKAVG